MKKPVPAPKPPVMTQDRQVSWLKAAIEEQRRRAARVEETPCR